ncbi:UDP-glucose 4-epimerase GalE [Roseomonas sp. CCTCC AB2023176]|uniref:UDP-glucose 4-epimerase GalE n=1 Tax=Roseomonas sp. CCTCC AB2023176 TaxID=3342640 RepID=UPI0035DE61E9
MPRYLVTGGAGYVGSHVVLALHRRGDEVVVLDNLRQGHRAALPQGVPLIRGDIGDPATLARAFDGPAYDGVLHFAALSLVGESMKKPMHYLAENLSNTARLAEAAVEGGCMRFVLSSTAALFGEAGDAPIHERTPYGPTSAYGESKGMAERALEWADKVHGLKSACLRYFNAAGADASGKFGEDHDPETHLIPNAIRAALGQGAPLTLFGTDYPTPDGTPIRDYVHVTDLAEAHLLALDHLDDAGSCRFNLGTGRGASVREVLAAVERITGRRVPHSIGPRRAGDPAVLVASNNALRKATGWKPLHSDLDTVVETAARWHTSHPNGYADRAEKSAKPRVPARPAAQATETTVFRNGGGWPGTVASRPLMRDGVD